MRAKKAKKEKSKKTRVRRGKNPAPARAVVRVKKKAARKARSSAKGRRKGSVPTKSEVRTRLKVLTRISKDTGLSRKQIGGVFDSLSGVIKKSLKSNGLFTMPGLLKMKVVKKAATRARKGIQLDTLLVISTHGSGDGPDD